jgi:uncharacterized DUF497 family protein
LRCSTRSARRGGKITTQAGIGRGGKRLEISGVIWLRGVLDKLQWKHNVTSEEAEEALRRSPRFRRIERGDIQGEGLYAAFGRSQAGRYLTVFFIYKKTHEALVVSART